MAREPSAPTVQLESVPAALTSSSRPARSKSIANGTPPTVVTTGVADGRPEWPRFHTSTVWCVFVVTRTCRPSGVMATCAGEVEEVRQRRVGEPEAARRAGEGDETGVGDAEAADRAVEARVEDVRDVALDGHGDRQRAARADYLQPGQVPAVHGEDADAVAARVHGVEQAVLAVEGEPGLGRQRVDDGAVEASAQTAGRERGTPDEGAVAGAREGDDAVAGGSSSRTKTAWPPPPPSSAEARAVVAGAAAAVVATASGRPVTRPSAAARARVRRIGDEVVDMADLQAWAVRRTGRGHS